MTDPTKDQRLLSRSILPYVADNAFSHLIIGPLTALYWRGTWEFLNHNLVPDQPDLSAWICFAVGNTGLVALAISQNLWTNYVSVEKTCSMRWFFGYHLYTYILAFLNVMHWRGMWGLLDHYTGVNEISSWASFIIGQCILWMFRCSKSLVSPPLMVEMDKNPEFFQHSGRFNAKFRMSTASIFDSIFTIVFIHQMTVFYWRGLWELCDVYLFPDDGKTSSVICLLISFLLHGLLCLVQPIFNHLYRSAEKSQHPKAWQWLLEVVIYSFGNPVCVTHWRGVWNLCSEYVDPSNADVIDASLHFGTIGLMMLMFCAHSLTVRGCFLEGDASVEDGCMFPNKYFRHWMEKREKEVMLKQQQLQLDQQQVQPIQQHQQLLLVENKTNVLPANGDSTKDKLSEMVMMITVL